MAQGDVTWFDQALVDAWEKRHDLENDVIKLALVIGTTVPAENTADPRWGPGGTVNFASEEVTPGGNYVAGGAVCANPAVILNGGQAEFDADDPPIFLQDPGNPNNAVWGILYNDTDPGKRCLAFVDIGGLFDMTTGDLQNIWGAAGIAAQNQAP